VVLIGWPERHAETYLKTVSEISRRLRSGQVRAKLLEADEPDQVIEALTEEP
jgi:mannitol/fructose-specific phosphotransferase system IIA component (Ntr-type)